MTLSLLVDAQSLRPKVGVTGIATYSSGLLGALSELADLDVAALCVDGVTLPDGVTPVVVSRRTRRLRGQLMENSLRLPLEVRRHCGHHSVYHSLSFHPVPSLQAPWVQTLHDVIPLVLAAADLDPLRRRWRRLAPRYRRASAVIAVSQHAADDGI